MSSAKPRKFTGMLLKLKETNISKLFGKLVRLLLLQRYQTNKTLYDWKYDPNSVGRNIKIIQMQF